MASATNLRTCYNRARPLFCAPFHSSPTTKPHCDTEGLQDGHSGTFGPWSVQIRILHDRNCGLGGYTVPEEAHLGAAVSQDPPSRQCWGIALSGRLHTDSTMCKSNNWAGSQQGDTASGKSSSHTVPEHSAPSRRDDRPPTFPCLTNAEQASRTTDLLSWELRPRQP